MNIFPDYIYSYIIKCILEFIYNKCKIKTHYYFKRYEFGGGTCSYNNQAIELSLVSKKWFSSIQKILSNEILNFKNFKVLKSFIENKEEPSEFKLIRSPQIMVFQSFSEFQIFRKRNSIKEFKKVLVKVPTNKVSHIILGKIDKFPPNCVFNLTIILQDFKETHLNFGSSYRDYLCSGEVNCINRIKLGGIEDQYIKYILKLNPRSVSYFPNFIYLDRENVNTSAFFEDSNSLESFKVNNSVQIEPIDLASLSLKSKLKSITVPIAFHQIIRLSHNARNGIIEQHNNDDEEGGYSGSCIDIVSFRNNFTIESDWNLMVKVLSNNSTLKELSLYNVCGDTYDCLDEHYDTSLVSNGLASIITKNISIETLTLEGYNFIDSTLIKSLASNQTIKTLILSSSHEELIFNQVLNGANKTIRNVILKNNISSNDTFNHFKKLNHLELYSISFMNETIKSFNQTLEILKSSTNHQFNIKEINFYFSDSPPNQKGFNNKSINGILINVFFLKKEDIEWNYSDIDSDVGYSDE
ncbi:expressed protein [Dictyostelium purpureum]|uniref:Expressed protein n=1 Tax=Dictyostelium purpureum TaxID=5786 RepID=F0ZNR8_DICPU|nr:uncharacterized protein DICPUDRAFT_98233 [Dictyostelium purpureum]EGC34387.1 expressed protein [Dictyostelium purpureum]|eukprot:XP_003289061.1 expressed protein [Dictyostelium purpureum]